MQKTRQVVGNLSFLDTSYVQKKIIQNRNIFASYVPTRPDNISRIEGVFEVYKDVTPIISDIKVTQTKVIVSVVGTLAGLFFVVRRIDKIIQSH